MPAVGGAEGRNSKSYYNELDPYAAAWLRNLIAAGHIAPGDVDERSITEVKPGDLHGYTQCHFFAGIGVWSHALRQAGWPDERPIWTGSCPCQPFSGAGKGKGFKDERHLWPVWRELVRECRPDVLVGEQVAHKRALPWLDAVCADLEDQGYACGAADLCAAGAGAPHIRQRLYWMAYAQRLRRDAGIPGDRCRQEGPGSPSREEHAGRGGAGGLAYAGCVRSPQQCWSGIREQAQPARSSQDGASCRLGDAGSARLSQRERQELSREGRGSEGRAALQSSSSPGACNGFWADAQWLYCRDGKWRPAEPGTFPLAHGAPARVGRLRAYGNAICAPLATEFLKAVMDELG